MHHLYEVRMIDRKFFSCLSSKMRRVSDQEKKSRRQFLIDSNRLLLENEKKTPFSKKIPYICIYIYIYIYMYIYIYIYKQTDR